jgi:hypothetical protein
MFVGKARSLPRPGTPESCFTRVGSGLTRKHSTRQERRHDTQHDDIQHNDSRHNRNSEFFKLLFIAEGASKSFKNKKF